MWSTSQTQPPFLNRKAFAELSGRNEEEQRRLLNEASREAFRGWRFILPLLPWPLVQATSVALGHILPKVTALPQSDWIQMVIAVISGGLGGWLTMHMMAAYLRPYLRKALESSHNAS